MKIIILLMTVFSFIQAEEKPKTITLKIKVQNVQQHQGVLIAGLYNSYSKIKQAKNKPDKSLVFAFASLDLEKATDEEKKNMTLVFNIPPGEYGVALYQDMNGDRTLNKKGPFGKPTEAYALSGNPKPSPKFPSREKIFLYLQQDAQVELKLRHL